MNSKLFFTRKKVEMMILLIIMAFTFLITYKINNNLGDIVPKDAELGNSYEKAKVIAIEKETLEQDPEFKYINIGKQYIEGEILTGENKGNTFKAINFVGRVDNKPVQVGNKIIVSSYDNFRTTVINNYSRENQVYVLIIIFITIVLIFGKSKGVKSLFSLIFTILLVIFLFIPLVIKGINPILASVVVVVLATIVTMVSLNGITRKTVVAAVSCILCTVIAGGIAYLFGQLTNLSTYNTIEAEELLFIASKTSLNVKNLLFSGILISSLGAIMDTTVSITSAVFEISDLNNDLNEKELFKSAINIGKDIMGTMTNTLILAFTGSSINILIIYFIYNLPYIQLINIDLIIIELIQGLSGGIAVILSIPVTAILASKLVKKKIKSY